MGNAYGYLGGRSIPETPKTYQPVLQKTTSVLSLFNKNTPDFQASLKNALERKKQQEGVHITDTTITYTIMLSPVYNPVTQLVDMHFIDTHQFGHGQEGLLQGYRTFKTETPERVSDSQTPIPLIDSLAEESKYKKPLLPFMTQNIKIENTSVRAIKLLSVTNPYEQELEYSLLVCNNSKPETRFKFKIPPTSNGICAISENSWPGNLYKNKMSDLFEALFLHTHTFPVSVESIIEIDDPSEDSGPTLEAFLAKKAGKKSTDTVNLTPQEIETIWHALSKDFVILQNEDYLLSTPVAQLLGNKLENYPIPRQYIPEDKRKEGQSFYLVSKKDIRSIQTMLHSFNAAEKNEHPLQSTLVYHHKPVTGTYFKQQVETLSYAFAKKKENSDYTLDYLSSPRNIITLTFGFELAMVESPVRELPKEEKEKDESEEKPVDGIDDLLL